MYKNCFKRIIDVVISILAIILLSWLYLIIALLIKCTSKGPVLFKQDRIGKDGNVFNILKFRSMRVGAEKSGVYSDFQKRMFEVRPGMTGWAQVNGRKDVEWNRRIELNVWYVDHLSFGLDFKIFWLTIF